MIMKIFLIVLFCIAIFATVAFISSCEKKPQMLDGPGMINPFAWRSFTVSRSDTYAQNNFYIEVEVCDEGLVVTGEVIGENGNYREEEGIVLRKNEAEAIFELHPADLPDCKTDVTESSETKTTEADSELFPDGVEMLDGYSVDITVYYADGRTVKKIDEDDFSLKVYSAVIKSFERKHGR